MGKSKRRKPGLSDRVNETRQKDKSNKLNPFEIKTNRQKHNVLGRKLAKHDQGRPGVSRSRALKKRKDTLLKEYKQKSKSNKFVDRRIGEEDSEMSVEDKMMQRFALEKQRSHQSSTLYNLESEELTHYGQSLSEIEKFDDPINSDDEDADRGILDKSVGQELFGGFLEKKKPQEPSLEKMSWKEKMQEMIARSKDEKREKQGDTEKIRQMTLDVDKQWKHLSLVMADCRRGRDTVEAETAVDDYDIAVNTMKFDITAMPSDRLKTEEEIAKDEAEKLNKLEADRLSRMSGILESDVSARASSEFRSADDLDDGLTVRDSDAVRGVRFAGDDSDDEVDSEESGNEEEAGEDSDGDNEDSGEDNEDSDEDGEDEDSGEDVASDDDDEKEEEIIKMDGSDELKSEDNSYNVTPKSILKKNESKSAPKKIDFKVRKEMMDKARSEMPYTYEAPMTYCDLDSLLEGHTPQLKEEIVSRLRKCHHISLAADNKDKLEKLFGFLTQYVCDMAISDPPEYATINSLTPHLYHLCQLSPVPCAQLVVTLIAMRHREYSDLAARKAGRGVYPSLDVIILLRLVSVLFPTSDYKHPVVTPALLFILQILAQSPVKTLKDLSCGLFLCTLCLTYVSKSKRFVPELINYLHGCLFLATHKASSRIEPVINPFKPIGNTIDLLRIATDQSQTTIVRPLKLSECLEEGLDSSTLDTDLFRLRLIDGCIETTSTANQLYTHLPSYTEIFAPITNMLDRLPTDLYPHTLQTNIGDLSGTIQENSSRVRGYLVVRKDRPKALRMYECQVEDKFDGRKKHKGKPEQKEQQKLKYQCKKEMKGAIRELKKDAQFLSRHELEEQRKRDSQRKRKVKEIYSMLSMQEGEYNKLKREKNWGKH